jgi:two-component system CheB/CheR fusion protein
VDTPENTAMHKTTAQKLVASEVRYRRLFESAKVGILILNAENGMIEDANPFITSLLGYSLEECIGKYVWELRSFKNVAASKEKFLELQQQDYVRYEDIPLENAQGKAIPVEFVSNIYLATASGSFNATFATFPSASWQKSPCSTPTLP